MKRVLVLVAAVVVWSEAAWAQTPTPTIPTGAMKFCRGGTEQGELCSVDGDCAGGGICTRYAHPRRCRWERRCHVTTSIKCDSDLECPGYPWADPNNWCGPSAGLGNTHNMTRDCNTDADCKICTAGTNIGFDCSGDGDCGSGGVCGAGGTGVCLNGLSSGECNYNALVGVPHDTIGDLAVGARTGEDAEIGGNSPKTVRRAAAVAIDKTTGDLWTKDVVSARKRPSPLTQNMDATVFLGQADGLHQQDQRMPGDVTHCTMSQTAPNVQNWTLYGDVLPWPAADANVQGTWVAERYAICRYAQGAATFASPLLCLGYVDAAWSVRSWFSYSDNIGQIAMQRRCVGGSSKGTPCTVDGDCPSSSCKVSMLIADASLDASRVALYRDVGSMRFGSIPDAVFGHSSVGYCESGSNANGSCLPRCAGGANAGLFCVDNADCPSSTCNRNFDCPGSQCSPRSGCLNYNGSVIPVDARTLCQPYGVGFDPSGNIWVSDGGIAGANGNRVLRYDKAADSGASANLVLGQANLTSGGAAASATGLNGPGGIDFSSDGDLAVADRFSNRIVINNAPISASGESWDVVIGQADFVSPWEHPPSSDFVKCDRVRRPQIVRYDGSDNLWVADTDNKRFFRCDAPLATNMACNASTLQGQPDCSAAHSFVNARSFDQYSGGVVETEPGLAHADSESHRIVWWDTIDHARSIDATGQVRAAAAIIGQSDEFKFHPSQGLTAAGGSTAANTLKKPRFLGYAAAGPKSGSLYAADTGHHRVTRYAKPYSTNMNAAEVIGQADFTGSQPNRGGSVGSNTLYSPTSAKPDVHGNVWIADWQNQRVVLKCEVANTVPADGGGFVCTAGNSGDGTWDLVLGKANMTEGFSTTPCGDPALGNKLCAPYDVIPDLARNRVIVSDQRWAPFGGNNQDGRVLIFKGPFSSGMSADSSIGSPDGLPPLWGKPAGRCTATGDATPDADLWCSYKEPAGAAAGSGGKTCVAPASKYGVGCSANSQCDSTTGAGDGQCGCPSGQYCLWNRTVGLPGAIALHPTRDYLLIMRHGFPAQNAVVEYRDVGNTYTGQSASRVYGQSGPLAFSRNNQPTVAHDHNWLLNVENGMGFDTGGDLYVAAGNGGVFQNHVYVLDDPLPANTPTQTPANTPTTTNTVAVPLTSTSTPTVTPTPTHTLTNTVTRTVTSTPTWTPTNTLVPGVNTPTQTNTPTTAGTPTATGPLPGGQMVVNDPNTEAVVQPGDTAGSSMVWREAKASGGDQVRIQAPASLNVSRTLGITANGYFNLFGLEAPGQSNRCVRVGASGVVELSGADCVGPNYSLIEGAYIDARVDLDQPGEGILLPSVDGMTCDEAVGNPVVGQTCIQRNTGTDGTVTMPSLWFGIPGGWLKTGALYDSEWAWPGACNNTSPTLKDFELPGANAPTLSCITTGTNLPTKAVLAFPSGSTTCAYTRFPGNWLIQEYAGALVPTYQASAVSGTVTWQVSTACVGDDVIDDAAWQVAGSFTATVPSATTRVQFVPIGYTPCGPSSFTRVRLCRTGGTVATAWLVGLRKDVVEP